MSTTKTEKVAVMLCNTSACVGDEMGCNSSGCGRGRRWRWWSMKHFKLIFDREPFAAKKKKEKKK